MRTTNNFVEIEGAGRKREEEDDNPRKDRPTKNLAWLQPSFNKEGR